MRKKALSHLNLELQDGDFATIIGSNGAGKSTMLKILAGLQQPTEGVVAVQRGITNWLFAAGHDTERYTYGNG